jgi:hypothetical protein
MLQGRNMCQLTTKLHSNPTKEKIVAFCVWRCSQNPFEVISYAMPRDRVFGDFGKCEIPT